MHLIVKKYPLHTLFWSTYVQYQCFNLLTYDQCKIYEKLNNDPNQVLLQEYPEVIPTTVKISLVKLYQEPM